VTLDRLLAEHEAIGDLAVGKSVLDENGDLALAVAQ